MENLEITGKEIGADQSFIKDVAPGTNLSKDVIRELVSSEKRSTLDRPFTIIESRAVTAILDELENNGDITTQNRIKFITETLQESVSSSLGTEQVDFDKFDWSLFDETHPNIRDVSEEEKRIILLFELMNQRLAELQGVLDEKTSKIAGIDDI